MKIVHLLGAREDIGGILTVLRNLQSVAPRQAFEHVVWVNARYRETRTPSLDYRFSRHLLDESRHPWRLLYGALRARAELRRLVVRESPDVLHVHTRGALPLVAVGSRRMGTPWLVTFHCYARRVRLYRWVARSGRVTTTLLTPEMARHYGLPLEDGRIGIVSECCSDRFFDVPAVERVDPPAAQGRFRFVGLGSVIREKNWHLVLEAFRRLAAKERQRLEFHHFGPTLADAPSRAYARELQERVQRCALQHECVFHGPALAVEDVLRAADWYLSPSTNEPCSVALIEALALGLPALASASGGNLDIVRPHRTGLLFEPESVDGLADCLRRVIHGDARMDSPTEVRESVGARRASVVAAEYGAVYKKLTNARGLPLRP